MNLKMLGIQQSLRKDAIPSTSTVRGEFRGFWGPLAGEINPEIHFNSRPMAGTWLA